MRLRSRNTDSGCPVTVKANARHTAVDPLGREVGVSLRRLPYPYRAMLAICSDLDETPNGDAYWEIMRFLNTTKTTAMGPGLGLEVGNSIYFDMPPDQFAYWNTDDAGREMVRTLIRSGHIDCLHSFGDLATERSHADRALEELARHDCRLEVWVDHGVAPTNLGPDIMQGHGDETGHRAYHADLTCAYGIKYVWRGRVTSVLGQDVPPRLRGIWTPRHPLSSSPTLAKEAAKRLLAKRGRGKYAMHGSNCVWRRSFLRDGQPVIEFIRANPHWGGVSCGDTGRDIADVITGDMLRRLICREGVCLLYTHLGKVADPRVPFGPKAVAALRRLAQAQIDGRMLVATTCRTLRYLTLCEELMWSVERDGGGLTLHVSSDGAAAVSREHLGGLTFYVPDGVQCCRGVFGGCDIGELTMNPPDHTGRRSAMVPWRRLSLPEIEV